MVDYNLYPAVDSGFNFPPHIRLKLSQSQEFVDVVDDRLNNTSYINDTLTYSNFVERGELSGLMPWNVAYSKRHSQACKAVVLGALEGAGATDSTSLFADILGQRLSDEGATLRSTWLPVNRSAQSPEGTPSYPVILSGTTSQTADVLGSRGAGLTGGTSPGEITVTSRTMAKVNVWYNQNNFFSSNFEILVDGILELTVQAIGDYVPAKVATVTMTPGPHTVKVRANGASNQAVSIAGIEVFETDTESGVSVYDGSRYATRFRDIAESDYDTTQNKYIEAINPDLVIIAAGSAEYLSNTIGFSEGPIDQISGKMDSLITKDHSILFVLEPRPVPSSGTLDHALYASLRNYLAAQARVKPDRVALLDLNEHWPRLYAGGATSLGLMAETDYPQNMSSAGYAYAADVVADYLS